MTTSARVVVVGAGLAAARCVGELMRRDNPPSVVVLSNEDVAPYDRPPLTKTYLREGGSVPELGVDWTGIDLRLSSAAESLDLDRGVVRLQDGTWVAFDDLVIATGARPRRLRGLEGPGVHTIRDVGDADALRSDLHDYRQVVVVGGGFLGCEVATTARLLGAHVVLIEALSAPLERVLGKVVGRQVAARHEAQGVEVITSAAVVGVRRNGRDRTLELASGELVPAPVVVVGLGVSPETGWLTGSGLDIQDGVRCDPVGRTSADHVYAAGDVARWFTAAGGSSRTEHWTAAGHQGRVVAATIVGVDPPADDVPYVWSDQTGVTMQLLGTPHVDDDVTLIDIERPGSLLALYGRDGRLTAAFGIASPRMVLRHRAAIASGADYAETVASAATAASG